MAIPDRSSCDYEPFILFKSLTGGISVKVYGFYQKMRRKDHRHIVYLEKTQGKERYSRIRSLVKIPRCFAFEGNPPVLMQWQRKTLMSVLSDGTNCLKYYHTEVEYWSKKNVNKNSS